MEHEITVFVMLHVTCYMCCADDVVQEFGQPSFAEGGSSGAGSTSPAILFVFTVVVGAAAMKAIVGGLLLGF